VGSLAQLVEQLTLNQ